MRPDRRVPSPKDRAPSNADTIGKINPMLCRNHRTISQIERGIRVIDTVVIGDCVDYIESDDLRIIPQNQTVSASKQIEKPHSDATPDLKIAASPKNNTVANARLITNR